MARATLARVFPEHIRHNAGRVRALAPHSRIMACVKADAYGHDIGLCSNALKDHVDGFAVACIEEALIIRRQHPDKPVLMLEGPHSQSEVDQALAEQLTLCINDWHQLEWLEQRRHSDPLACWLKVDTGMHRLGFQPENVSEAFRRLEPHTRGSKPVLCSHFSSADLAGDPRLSDELTCFDRAVKGIDAPHSTANSAAVLRAPASHRDWVRPGYMLYGGSPLSERSAPELDLKPAMEFSAAVISLRDIPAGERVGYSGRWIATRPSRIATIAAGYGDGYPRHAPDGTPVLICDRRLPLAGRVSMDMITVDVTDHPAVTVGARAVLWGAEPGVDEVARWADTIGYELLAAMPKRVERVASH